MFRGGLLRGLPLSYPAWSCGTVCVVIQPGSGPLLWSTPSRSCRGLLLAPRLVPENRLDKAPCAALTGGFHWALWACGTVTLLALPTTVALLRRKTGLAGWGVRFQRPETMRF